MFVACCCSVAVCSFACWCVLLRVVWRVLSVVVHRRVLCVGCCLWLVVCSLRAFGVRLLLLCGVCSSSSFCLCLFVVVFWGLRVVCCCLLICWFSIGGCYVNILSSDVCCCKM